MPTSDAPDFLIHDESDDVAIATRDLPPGRVTGGYLVGTRSIAVDLAQPVPLGHKFSLRDIDAGDEVVEYGVSIGLASTSIAVGHHVHIHNLRSARWQNSLGS